ncbi:uncharacterized protein LOC126998350 isoform X2 [Eriocheir sinensis]|uniref:uncharacterized protein LOC126998350 isoform X2 n=1 Tax=Eriocheir sinensis TaxID=95602 RepID=UPI0021C83A52|nr:uncharacterized protein LOC126998350 isoform X2 [Eriocheir sinensis]
MVPDDQRTTPAMSLKILSILWPLRVAYVLLAVMVPVSLQGDVGWGTEYPLVPWEDLWREVEEMTEGMQDCHAETSTCWPTTNTSVQAKVAEVCRPCACDKECVRYGECCRDKAQADWGDGREEGSDRYNCRRMRPFDSVGLLMVESCLPEYRNTPVERLCTQQVPEEAYSYILDLGVTSRRTNTTYGSYHCAVCNNDAASLHTHEVTINCFTREILKEFTMKEFMRKATYKPGSLQLQRFVYESEEDERLHAYREIHHCSLQVAEFNKPLDFVEKYGGRLCLYPKAVCEPRFHKRPHCREQVRHCDPLWPDPLDVEKCRRYSQMVLHTTDTSVTLYKNPHCARCNFVNMSMGNFQCLDPNDPNMCSSAISIRKINLPPVFSVLMDFRNSSCDAQDELWDPIHLACRKVFCGQLYKLSNGFCVRDPEVFAVLENSTLLYDSCRKIKLSMDEFTPRSDGSMHVNATNKVYEQGEYEMLSDGNVLICSDNDEYVRSFTTLHQLLTLVTMVVSLLGLALHIVIYILVPRHRNLPGKNLFSLSCCLFLAYLIFLTGIRATEHHGFCVFISASLHFFWLASFCWMSVMSVDVCRTFTSQVYRGDSAGYHTYALYSLYAWGVPTLVVTLALICDYVGFLPEYRPQYATNLCWINNSYGLATFFLLPQGAIVLENTLLFLVTARGIYKQMKAAKFANRRSQSVKGTKEKTVKIMHKGAPKEVVQNRRSKKERLRLVLYVKLAVIQGVSWVTGFIAAFADLPACWYVFTVFNGLQGAFIFIGFDMKKKVWESVWESVMGTPWSKRHSSKETRTTTTGRTLSGQKDSNSDSEGGSELDSASGPLVRERSVGRQAGAGVGQSTSSRHCSPPNAQAFDRVRKLGTTGSQRTQADSPAPLLPAPEDEAPQSQPVGMRTGGDLRARVVRGNFDGERPEETAKLKSEGPNLPHSEKGDTQKNKPNVQRVMDLLQQLQRDSRSSVDLPDLVQQLLKCSGGSYEASMVGGSFKGDDRGHFKDFSAPYQVSRSHSLANTAHTSHNSLYSPSKEQPSQLPTSSNPATTLTTPHTNIKRTQEISSNLERIPKSQSFSQISKVALAASFMQKAAMDAREKRQQGTERTLGSCRGKRESLQHVPSTKKPSTSTPESLV